MSLKVKNFDLLNQYESRIVHLMQEHGGRIVAAMETCRNDDGSGEELHIVEFTSEAGFNDYKNDPRYRALAELREAAIAETTVKQVLQEKHY